MDVFPKILGSAAAMITIGFGIWHFFIPKKWKWYEYIHKEAEELKKAVRAINVFFSLCLVLFGLMTIIFLWHEPVDLFYILLSLICLIILWTVRVIMQVVYPQGSKSKFLRFSMLGAFIFTDFLFILCLILIIG